MTNTQLRILSALVLVILVGVCVYVGKFSSLIFIGLASLLIIDEVLVNFFKRLRNSKRYLLCQLIFLIPYTYFHFIDPMPGLFSIFINAALVLNMFYLFYLFFYKSGRDGRFLTLMASFPLIASLIVLLPIMSLTSIFYLPEWRSLLAVLLIVNFSMDTGAWFFGKKFGKRKLWEAVSPKKTIEGLVGGALTAAIVASFSWFLLFETFNWQLLLFFSFLGVMSQVGDLLQSKIKRQFEIKDSSSLIPGHGGVYDRLDGLLFVTPFYATLINTFYFH